MKSTLGSINTSRNLLQDGNGVSENSRAERAISTRTRKHQGPNLLPLLIICISHSQGYPPFSHAARQHRPPSCPTPTSLFPLYRLACSASQTCSWKRLPLTCLSASKRRQALVSANSKFPRTESNWPSLGQVSTLIKFSVTGRGSWEKEDRLGPALWMENHSQEKEDDVNGWGKHPSDWHKLQVRDVSEFGKFFSFWNFLEFAFIEV